MGERPDKIKQSCCPLYVVCRTDMYCFCTGLTRGGPVVCDGLKKGTSVHVQNIVSTVHVSIEIESEFGASVR